VSKEETVVLRCPGEKNDGTRCTRDKEFSIDDAPEEWRCWQHPPKDKKKKANKGGRPSKYDDVNLDQVKSWAKEGLTDYEISRRLGIGTTTLYDWKNKFPEFSEALKRAKKQADFRVKDSLYQRANGYKYNEVTKERVKVYDGEGKVVGQELITTKVVTKEVKPDVTAQIFWLKNRQPEEWKDKKDIDVTSGGKELSAMTAEEREKRRQELRKKLGDT